MPVPGTPRTVQRSLLREDAYAALREAILDGTLAPGERLRDPELCAWLGLSRTPVREALARLQDDGLIETAPHRYTRVTSLDRRQARDAFELVAALHALAAELAVPRIGEPGVARMRADNSAFAAALRAGDVDAAIAADDRFHGRLVDASGNGEIAPALARLVPRLRRLERLRFGTLAGRGSVRQHARIADLTAAGRTTEAAAAARDNWLSLGALIDRAFEEDRP